MAKRPPQFGDVSTSDGRMYRDGAPPTRTTRPTQLGEDHLQDRVEVERADDDPRARLGMQLEQIAKDLSVSPEDLLSGLRDQKAAQDPNVESGVSIPDGRMANPGLPNSKLPRSTVIRNRTQVIRTSAAIISALQEALDYNPKIQHNQTPPDLWRDNKEYIAALRQIADELKELNNLLKKQSSAQKENNSVLHLGLHINQFLTGFSSVAGKGTGWLLIAALGGLLYQTGIVPDLAENVLKHIKLPK